MSKTSISDVIVPEVFNQYIVERTAAKSKLLQSGIMQKIPGITIPEGGTTVKIPNWKDLDSASGDLEVLSDSDALTPAKITSDKQIAAILARGKAWSANDLAKAFSGDDPMGAIADLAAAYWARQQQITLVNVLNGLFATSGCLNSTHNNDISGGTDNDALIKADDIIDTMALLGDAGGELSGIVCHSAVMWDLAKKNILDAKYSSDRTQMDPALQSYLGRRVICEDSLTPTSGVYTTYLFSAGAIGFAEGGCPNPVETDRDKLAGDDILITRKHFVMHPYGTRWIGSAAGATPTNAELATVANWEKVFETKNIRIVRLVHKIGALS